ncbi:MAG: RNA-binding cell elongation regulator Jag/EloR [Capsulimonadales bacterium]|nr:RNA-binding cell elongation regulator Jag/EloR [Capsulimonadales bacterium]
MAGTVTELKQQAIDFAQGFVDASGMDLHVAVTKEEPEGITMAFGGSDARLFIGKGGQCLDALQYLTTLAVLRRSNTKLHITYDADNYRLRRENTLLRMAEELAEQVIATGQEAVLDPMTPAERRIVHQALVDRPGVRTYSEGEEPDRYLVIAPMMEE